MNRNNADREFLLTILDRLLAHPEPEEAISTLEKLLIQFQVDNKK